MKYNWYYTLMENAGLEFRGTKDLDIVLCVEVLDAAFVKHFWKFIEAGKYEIINKNSGEPCFYRFTEPVDSSYPAILELFSRKPDALIYEGKGHLTPISVEYELSGLSAILLDQEYYDFLHTHKQILDGLTIVGPEGLIPLKAKAWMELTDLRASGVAIRSSDIKKHRGDIPRLFRLLASDMQVTLPTGIKKDMNEFLDRMQDQESKVSLQMYGVKNMTYVEFLDTLRKMYSLK